MVNARRSMQQDTRDTRPDIRSGALDILAAELERREQRWLRENKAGNTTAPPTCHTPTSRPSSSLQRVSFDGRGYARPTSVFPPGALTPQDKVAHPQETLATQPRAGASRAVRAQKYLIDTPSSAPSTPELTDAADWELVTERYTARQASFVVPARQSVRNVVHAPDLVTYDHRCRETRLPHVKRQDPQDEYLHKLANHEKNVLPPLQLMDPRRRTKGLVGWSAGCRSGGSSAKTYSSGGSDDSQLSLHKYDDVEAGARQANPQTLNFRTVQLPSGSTVNVSFVGEYNRRSYMPWAR